MKGWTCECGTTYLSLDMNGVMWYVHFSGGYKEGDPCIDCGRPLGVEPEDNRDLTADSGSYYADPPW